MKKRLFLFLPFLLFSVFVWGKNIDTIQYSNENQIDIVPFLSNYIDRSDTLDIQHIINADFPFKNCGTHQVHIDFTHHPVWHKCIIKNVTNKPAYLNIEIENPTIYSIRFFSVHNKKIISSIETGIKYPFYKRQVSINTFVFRLKLDTGQTTACYFIIKSNGDALNFPVRIISNAQLFKKNALNATILGIIIGFIFALLMVAGFSLYLNFKEYTYIYFALYSIFGGLWLLNNDGTTYQYFWSNFPKINEISILLIPILAIYYFSKFGIKYLNIKTYNTTLYRFFRGLNIIIVLTIVTILTGILSYSIIVKFVIFEIFTTAILTPIASFLIYKKNKELSINYIAANSLLVFAIIWWSLDIVFGFSTNGIRSYIMKGGLLFQMFFLLLALIIKIRKAQKTFEQNLKDSKQKYFDILENAIEAIFVIQDRKIKFSNTQLSIISKYRNNELIDFEFSKIIFKDDLPIIEDLLHQHEIGINSERKVVFRTIDKDGFENWMEMNSVSILWEGKPATLNFMNDISQRVQSEKEKEVLEKQLLHAQKMKTIGTLAGGIAHDFNNILTPIIGYSDLLLDSVETEEQKEDVLNIKTSANRAKEIVSQILRFSHQIDSEREIIPVHKIINEVAKLMDAAIPSSIQLKLHLTEKELFVKINPTQFHQVMMNICTNAYQAINPPKGNISITTLFIDKESATLLLPNELTLKEYIKISIQDTGSGISPEVKARIFDPFFTTKKIGEGTGLGLSVVYGIIKNNGGIITCDSEVGKGTTFNIYLPYENPDNQPENQIANQIVKGHNEKILIVDDEIKILTMMKKILERHGFSITTENDSNKALSLIQSNPQNYQILVTDISMPQMTGIELAQKAREKNPHINIIFLSGFVSNDYSEAISAFNNSKLLLKPINIAILIDNINKLLNINIEKTE